MKKILLLFLIWSFFCKCNTEEKDIICCIPPYEFSLSMSLVEIKDPSVKSIKLTFENLDGIDPEFRIYSASFIAKKEPADAHLQSGITYLHAHGGSIILKPGRLVEQDRKQYVTENGKIHYFRDMSFYLYKPYEELGVTTHGKKRTYELKMYINDKLFFTKKISFIPKENGEGYLYSDKVEVDNMDFVKEISSDFRPSWNWLIEITDADLP